MAAPSQFDELMKALRAGSPTASEELLRNYGEHIRRVIRRNLSSRLRRLFDSQDFQQAVWKSFFAAPREQIDFRTPEELAGYLSAIAGNKVAEEYRVRFDTMKRDLAREKHLADVGEDNPAIERRFEASPSQLAAADECWERLVRNRPPLIRQMLELLRDGHSHAEIARQTGLHLKAIQRHLRRLRKGIDP